MDLNKALGSLALQLGHPGDDCRIIAFTGCAPGCGATTLATNAAYEMAVQHKQRTVLVELSQQTGVLATNLDLRPTSTLSDLLTDPEQMDAELVQRSLVRVADHFDILAGNHGVYPPKVIDLPGVLRVLDYLRPLAQYVVLDVPCSYDEFQFEILRRARQIVLVGEQSISSIRTLKLILDTLRSGPTQHSFHVVMNRYDSQMTGLTVNNLEKALGLTNIRTIPDDRLEVLVAANEGKLLRQMDSNSQVLAKIDALVDTLLDIRNPSEQSGIGRFLNRFFNAFRT
jgi:pilus assembly protein CpaE